MKFAHILVASCLLILGGCSTVPAPPLISSNVSATYPPDSLLVDCKNAYRPTNTTGEVVDQLVTTRGALDECALKVACVREWRKQTDSSYVAPAEWLQCVDPAKPETTIVVADGKPLKPLPRPKIKAKAGAKAVPKAVTKPPATAAPKAVPKANPKRRPPMKPIPEDKIKDALPLR